MVDIMKSALIIKPLAEDYETVYLRCTNLEGTINPFPHQAEDKYRDATTKYLGNLFEEVVMSTIVDKEAGELMEEAHSTRIENLDFLRSHGINTKSAGKNGDVEFLKYKLENKFVSEIGTTYYDGDVMSCQNALMRPIHCGKYLVFLTGTSDIFTKEGEIRDIKYYGSKFGEAKLTQHKVYTLDNYIGSAMEKKMQRYIYPRLYALGEDNMKFFYDVYPKAKNAPNDKKPENHLKREVFEFDVDISKAEAQIKSDIIQYFSRLNEHNEYYQDRIDTVKRNFRVKIEKIKKDGASDDEIQEVLSHLVQRVTEESQQLVKAGDKVPELFIN